MNELLHANIFVGACAFAILAFGATCGVVAALRLFGVKAISISFDVKDSNISIDRS